MVVSKLEVAEGTQYQGADEELVYTLTTTKFGSTPSSVTVTVKDLTANWKDVTSDVTSGSTSIASDVITLPTVKSLTPDHTYRVEVKFTSGSSIFEPYFIIEAEL